MSRQATVSAAAETTAVVYDIIMGMNVAIVGFGTEGIAAMKYWTRLGANITVCDQDHAKEVPHGIDRQLGETYLHDLDRFDIIWRTAGINPEVILQANPGVHPKITSTINEFMQACPTKHVIGVTGTKGKGTTSTLISQMLTAAGEKVFLAGNIGISPLVFLPQITEESWVVLELSSFQLVDLKYSPSIALCLMVVPEHLDWHKTMDNYILAKAQLFEHQTPEDLAIYFARNENSLKIAGYSPALKMPYYAEPGAHVEQQRIVIAGNEIARTDEIKLLGEHNWQKVCAAVTAAWQITQNIEAMRTVITSFGGLEHRLEYVRTVHGVKYFNDSFASTPDAAMAAMNALHEPKVIILGGYDRKLPLDHLARCVADHQRDIRKVALIGTGAGRLASELDKIGFKNYDIESSKNMPAIVFRARTFAQSGDVVLLSPGFSSFDMFKNFIDRGEQFKQSVRNL